MLLMGTAYPKLPQMSLLSREHIILITLSTAAVVRRISLKQSY